MVNSNYKSEYSAKLRDPRWQKKRLEIMQRDKFSCQCCGDGESTLNVHHFEYHGDPWSTPPELLITLCEQCHENEGYARKESEKQLLSALRKHRFLSHDVKVLAMGFENMQSFHVPEVMASVINWAMCEKELTIALTNMFFESIKPENKNG